MHKTLFIFLITAVLLSGCQEQPKQTIEGLWVVKLVQVGDQEMTPNARWVRFNADSTHLSGNGRFSHSYGTWSLDKENRLSFVNINGLKDSYEPFDFTMKDDTMYWSRTEEGQEVKVTLARADQLPETYGDQLLGLWHLEEAKGKGMYAQQPGDYIFLRWDKLFIIGTSQGRVRGVYHVNGHKPELELIPYSDELDRNFWSVEYGENSITLNLLNTDSTVMRKYVRIHQFPEN